MPWEKVDSPGLSWRKKTSRERSSRHSQCAGTITENLDVGRAQGKNGSSSKNSREGSFIVKPRARERIPTPKNRGSIAMCADRLGWVGVL